MEVRESERERAKRERERETALSSDRAIVRQREKRVSERDRGQPNGWAC